MQTNLNKMKVAEVGDLLEKMGLNPYESVTGDKANKLQKKEAQLPACRHRL